MFAKASTTTTSSSSAWQPFSYVIDFCITFALFIVAFAVAAQFFNGITFSLVNNKLQNAPWHMTGNSSDS